MIRVVRSYFTRIGPNDLASGSWGWVLFAAVASALGALVFQYFGAVAFVESGGETGGVVGANAMGVMAVLFLALLVYSLVETVRKLTILHAKFRPVSPWQLEDDCIAHLAGCGGQAVVEAVCGRASVRSCENEACKEYAAAEAIRCRR
ncbi:MAG TPA: hypothetical protein VMC43_02040 [Candidatus Paceibacterota bacterium]|nr:hypothetical protein [Candidatus Paceibacterota bacterium]